MLDCSAEPTCDGKASVFSSRETLTKNEREVFLSHQLYLRQRGTLSVGFFQGWRPVWWQGPIVVRMLPLLVGHATAAASLGAYFRESRILPLRLPFFP